MAGLRRCGAAAQANGSGHAVRERDSKRIIRLWDREIDDEMRRTASRDDADGPWKSVVWAALWVVWLVLLVALLAHVKSLG
jgi:heme O synthase-like polyprenyltransferase